MQISHYFKVAAVAIFAATVSFAAQAQLKNTPMHAALPDNAQMKDCLMCHQSYDAVAAKTEKMTPNPHSSHRGEPNCTNCHSVKAKPHFECNDCHEFKIKMKGE
jgi:hypothetical protein